MKKFRFRRDSRGGWFCLTEPYYAERPWGTERHDHVQLCAASTTKILGLEKGGKEFEAVFTKTKPRKAEKVLEINCYGRLVNSRAALEQGPRAILADAANEGYRYVYGRTV